MAGSYVYSTAKSFSKVTVSFYFITICLSVSQLLRVRTDTWCDNVIILALLMCM